ncbi:MAG: hypothetical protein QOH79_56, partial [Acidimicrobiaceae bacterium]
MPIQTLDVGVLHRHCYAVSTRKKAAFAVCAAVIAVALVLVRLGALDALTESKFCTQALALVPGTDIALEDQGSPGRDGCDIDRVGGAGDMLVLGFDCQTR